jgi:hypothetical protein
VDYVVTAKNRKTVYFVELKTDTVSRREQQDTYDTYLQRAKEIGLRAILEGLKDILLRTFIAGGSHTGLTAWKGPVDMILIEDESWLDIVVGGSTGSPVILGKEHFDIRYVYTLHTTSAKAEKRDHRQSGLRNHRQ